MYTLTVGESGYQVNIGKGRGENAATSGEDLAGHANGLSKITGDVGESSEKEVAEVVATKTAAHVKPVLKQAAQESFVFRERHHAVADVARGKDAILPAQAAGASAIVGDGDNRGQVGNRAFQSWMRITAANDVFPQATQQSRESSASAHGDNT